jgi:hypothetical protein
MALQMMATGAAISNELVIIGTFAREMGHRLGAVIAQKAPSCTTCADPARNGVRSMASLPAKNIAVGDKG